MRIHDSVTLLSSLGQHKFVRLEYKGVGYWAHCECFACQFGRHDPVSAQSVLDKYGFTFHDVSPTPNLTCCFSCHHLL